MGAGPACYVFAFDISSGQCVVLMFEIKVKNEMRYKRC